MKAREYELVSRAVEEGARHGWRQAHKHTDAPSEEAFLTAVHDAVMLALCEVFVFEEPPV